MKILFVAGGVPSRIGQCHVLDLVEALSKSHELTVVCCDLGTSAEADAKDGLRKIATLKCVPSPRRSLLSKGIRCVWSRAPVAVEGYRFAAMRDAVSEATRDAKYDVIIFEQLVTAQYGRLTNGAPKILFPVDSVSRLKWQRYRATQNPFRKVAFWADHLITKRYETQIYAEFDGVMLVSDTDANYVLENRQLNTSRVFLLPLAVDADYFAPRERSAESGMSLVFVGNMFNHINEDAILWFFREVWGELKQDLPKLKLYIVGNGPSSRMKALAETDSNVIVTGFLEDIRPPIWNATVFVSPLRMGTGVKNRILQAMAMGKAIIASPLTIEGIAVTDGEQVLVAESAGEWLRRCLSLLQNGGERERLGREARRYVEENHSLRAKTSRFLDIVKQVTMSRNEAQTESL
ncbi:MAG TPA: glycosyltransferase family 4 protein [Candidatus Acidoferrales bacterium]